MLDIVSPQYPSHNQGRRAKPRRRHFVGSKPQVTAPKTIPTNSAPKIVTLDWRLPARLRRPIREELNRERKKQAQRQAIVKFEKHPLYKPTAGFSTANRGAEHHTGDVYMHAKPGIPVSVPPYTGSFIRQQQTPSSHRQAKVQSSGYEKVPLAQKTVHHKAQSIDGMPKKIRPSAKTKMIPQVLSGERDVPFAWDKYKNDSPNSDESVTTLSLNDSGVATESIALPKRKFALPLHFSIFPLNLWPGKKRTAPATKKKLHDDQFLTSLS